MDLFDKNGACKLVPQCSYPLTAAGCVKRVYTDWCVLECIPRGLRLVDAVAGLSPAALQAMIGLPIAH